jgi:hypothetical protein
MERKPHSTINFEMCNGPVAGFPSDGMKVAGLIELEKVSGARDATTHRPRPERPTLRPLLDQSSLR